MTRCFLRTGPVGALAGETLDGGTVAFESVAPGGPWSRDGGLALPGRAFAGTYEEVAAALNNGPAVPRGLILIFSPGVGMEAFLDSLRERFKSVPCAGGAAARAEISGRGFVYPQASDVVAIALETGDWKSQTIHFHRPTGKCLRVIPKTSRCFAEVEVDGVRHSARAFFENFFAEHGLRESVWDRCALLDSDGRLLHLSTPGEEIHCGADLPTDGCAEIALFDRSFGEAGLASAVHPGSLVFACAGLHGLLGGPCLPSVGHSSAHLYGEIVNTPTGPAFANLSVTILTPESP